MKKLAFAFTLATLSSAAFAQYHNDIGPILEATSSARQIVKELEIKDMNLVVGAPEYKFIYKVFLEDLKAKEKKFTDDMNKIAENLSYDYSIVMAMKDKPKSDAIKQTIKDAEQRLSNKIASESANYQNAVRSFINPRQDLMQKCLSVLCVNQVMADFRVWIKRADKLNKNVSVYKCEDLKKLKYKRNALIDGFEDSATRIGGTKPIAIENNDERIPHIEKYGIEAFSKFNFSDIKTYGLEMLLKHGLSAITQFGVPMLEKYGVDNIKTYGIPALEKYGVVALKKYRLADLDKYGFELLEKYGLEDLKAYGREVLEKYGSVAVKKYGVELLMNNDIQVLEQFEQTFGLENLKTYGVYGLKNFALEDLKLYGVDRLENYGKVRLDNGVKKYGLENVLAYDLSDLDAFGVDNLKLYGSDNLNYYGLAAIKKFGLPSLKKWGLDNLKKFGEQNLKEISRPVTLISGSAYPVSWRDSVNSEEKNTVCAGVLGAKASAVLTSSWSAMSNFPFPSNSQYAVAHISGQMMLESCPSNQTCRGWETIYCGIEK